MASILLRRVHSSAGSPAPDKARRADMRATPPIAPARAVQRIAWPQLTPGVAGFRGGAAPVMAEKPHPAARRATRSTKAGSASATPARASDLIAEFFIVSHSNTDASLVHPKMRHDRKSHGYLISLLARWILSGLNSGE